jgi:DNA-binding NarL/FixJ family response regulator
MTSRLLLADSDQPTRVGLRVALSAAGFDIVREVEDHDAAVAAAIELSPELALVTWRRGDAAPDAVSRLAAARPGMRIVVLAEHVTGDGLLAVVLAGAVGYLSLDIEPSRLPHVLRGVLAGEVALPRSHSEHLLAELRLRHGRRVAVSAHAATPLSDREWEILELLGAGCSTAEMASRLRIADVTVRRHVSAVVAKLGVPDRASAAELVKSRSAA